MLYFERYSSGGLMLNPSAPFSSSICPVPSALLTFRTPQGEDRVVAASWVGIVCKRPSVLTLTLRRKIEGLTGEGGFAVNLLSDEQLASRSFLDLVGKDDVRLHSGSELMPGAGGLVECSVLLECPVRIECRKARFHFHCGQNLLRGEVAAVYANGRFHDIDEPVDLCKLNPFSPPVKEFLFN